MSARRPQLSHAETALVVHDAAPLLPANDFAARAAVQRLVDHLATLGSRTLGEFLDELGRREGVTASILQLLKRYADLTPGMLGGVGADRWATAPIRIVEGRQ